MRNAGGFFGGPVELSPTGLTGANGERACFNSVDQRVALYRDEGAMLEGELTL